MLIILKVAEAAEYFYRYVNVLLLSCYYKISFNFTHISTKVEKTQLLCLHHITNEVKITHEKINPHLPSTSCRLLCRFHQQ